MKTNKQLSIKGLFLPAIVLCSLLIVAGPSDAAPVPFSFAFDGSISGVAGVLFPDLGTGPMSGNITVNSATDPTVPGMYLNSITGLDLNIGGYHALYAPGANGILILNSPPMGGSDSITAFSSVTGMAINGVMPTSFQVSLTDPSGNVFDNLNLLDNLNLVTTPPSLKSFAMNQWRLNFGGDGNYVVGSLAHLTAVPLPAAVILFGAGLISLVGLGAGGLRNLRWPQA